VLPMSNMRWKPWGGALDLISPTADAREKDSIWRN
jgi:hypothetical protein